MAHERGPGLGQLRRPGLYSGAGRNAGRQPALVGRGQADRYRLRTIGEGPRSGGIRGFCPGPASGGTILPPGLEPGPVQAGLVPSFQVAFKESLSACHGEVRACRIEAISIKVKGWLGRPAIGRASRHNLVCWYFPGDWVLTGPTNVTPTPPGFPGRTLDLKNPLLLGNMLALGLKGLVSFGKFILREK